MHPTRRFVSHENAFKGDFQVVYHRPLLVVLVIQGHFAQVVAWHVRTKHFWGNPVECCAVLSQGMGGMACARNAKKIQHFRLHRFKHRFMNCVKNTLFWYVCRNCEVQIK